VRRALLFDLDDTLVIEEPAAAASFAATARAATAQHRVNPEALAASARERARELWYAAPTHEYCMNRREPSNVERDIAAFLRKRRMPGGERMRSL
jgi:FMN phosphatase YigB (HAD superfamily)